MKSPLLTQRAVTVPASRSDVAIVPAVNPARCHGSSETESELGHHGHRFYRFERFPVLEIRIRTNVQFRGDHSIVQAGVTNPTERTTSGRTGDSRGVSQMIADRRVVGEL